MRMQGRPNPAPHPTRRETVRDVSLIRAARHVSVVVRLSRRGCSCVGSNTSSQPNSPTALPNTTQLPQERIRVIHVSCIPHAAREVYNPNMSAFANSFILTGPTACGKTALALELAERIGGEIVALDSMTVYRGMDIGTAKPTATERARVPHHLIDVLDPWESLTVAWWLAQAESACAEIAARGKRPIFVGGTPFYLKALLHGFFPGPPADEELRRTLEEEAARD